MHTIFLTPSPVVNYGATALRCKFSRLGVKALHNLAPSNMSSPLSHSARKFLYFSHIVSLQFTATGAFVLPLALSQETSTIPWVFQILLNLQGLVQGQPSRPQSLSFRKSPDQAMRSGVFSPKLSKLIHVGLSCIEFFLSSHLNSPTRSKASQRQGLVILPLDIPHCSVQCLPQSKLS